MLPKLSYSVGGVGEGNGGVGEGSGGVTVGGAPRPEFQDPYGIVVLLQNDLVVVDLTSPGYPCFENPYPMDLHGSPVTSCTYLADCPGGLVPALYSVGTAKQNR